MKKVSPGIYRHYKGNQYAVIGIVKHSETLEDMVLYKSLYDSKEYTSGTLWVRPLNMFIEDVLVEGKSIPRFEYIGSN